MFSSGLMLTSVFGPPRGLVLATQQQNFAAISGTGVVVSVYARRPQAEMVVVGNAAMRQSDLRPWHPVGRVVAPSTAAIEAAIEAQRTLLIEAARGGVKELRPLKDVSLAHGAAALNFTDKVQLGSFRCTKCGAFNVARAEACTNCGAPRGDEAPRGSLTMAMRTKALDAGSCGFMPFDRGEEPC